MFERRPKEPSGSLEADVANVDRAMEHPVRFIDVPLVYSPGAGWCESVLTEPFYIGNRAVTRPYWFEVCLSWSWSDGLREPAYVISGITALNGWPKVVCRQGDLASRKSGPSFYDAVKGALVKRLDTPIFGRGNVAL